MAGDWPGCAPAFSFLPGMPIPARMQLLGGFLLIVGVACVAGGLLLQYLGDTATIRLWYRLRYLGLAAGASGLVLIGLGAVTGWG